jgi:two-component system OmpR family response regulator
LKLKVFLVEDSPDLVSALTELLTADGLCDVVGQASSERLALQWSFAREGGFDVAVVDLLLNEGSGFGVLGHLIKYQPGKVVVLSEYVSPAIAQRCLKLGAAAAFQKSHTSECVDYVRGLAKARRSESD